MKKLFLLFALAILVHGVNAQNAEVKAEKALEKVKAQTELFQDQPATRSAVIKKLDELNKIDLKSLSKDESKKIMDMKIYLKDYLDFRRSAQYDFHSIDLSELKNEKKTAEKFQIETHIKVDKERNQRPQEKFDGSEMLDQKNVQAANPCMLSNDTVFDYYWDGKWILSSVGVYEYDANGYRSSFTRYDVNQNFEEPQWEEWYRYTYSYNSDGRILAQTYENYDEDKEIWFVIDKDEYTYNADGKQASFMEYDIDWTDSTLVKNYREVWTFDANGYYASRTEEDWDAVNEEWDFYQHDTYTYTSDGVLETMSWDEKADDGSYVAERYWKFDPKGWELNTTSHWDYLNEFWSWGEVVLEHFDKDGFNSADGSFSSGDRELYTYADLDPYYHLEEHVSYGDLLTSYTYQEWDATNEEWMNIEKETDVEYTKEGYVSTYTIQNYNTEWVDSLRFTYTYEFEFDCNDEIDAAYYATEKEELFDAGAWQEYYYVSYFAPSFGDPDVIMSRVWDYENDVWDTGFKHHFIWDSDFNNEYTPAGITTEHWDSTNQDWMNGTHWRMERKTVYMGSGEISKLDVWLVSLYSLNFGPYSDSYSDFTFFASLLNYGKAIYKSWDSDNSAWVIDYADTTQYKGSEESYPTLMLEVRADTNNYKTEISYNNNNDITNALYSDKSGSSWVKEYEEIFSYNTDNKVTQYLEKMWLDNDTDSLLYKADITYDGTDNKYVVDSTYEMTSIGYNWAYIYDTGQFGWLAEDKQFWGEDWDIHMDYDSTDEVFTYTDWYVNQSYQSLYFFVFDQRYEYGHKYWDTTNERWWYNEYEYAEKAYSACAFDYTGSSAYIPEYIYAVGSSDGRSFVNDFRYTWSLSCPDWEYKEFDWNETGEAWVETYYEWEDYETNSSCNDVLVDWEEAYYNENLGEFEIEEGYEVDSTFDEFGRLIENYEKEWSNGDLTGNRWFYNYYSDVDFEDDWFLSSEIYQYIDAGTGDWENSSKTVNSWVGNRPLTVLSADITDVTCVGDSTGAIDLEFVGGNGELTYNWSNGMTTQDLSGVPAGVYTLTVTDEEGCQTMSPKLEVETEQPSALELTINVTDASGEWTPDGMAVAEVSGGWPGYDHANPEYMYQWDDLANQTNDSLLYVHGGEYTLTVTDQLGCTITKTVTVEPYIPYGINTLEGAGFTAYPNPSTSNLTITVKAEYMGSDLSIHSVNGQKIFSKVVDQSNINIDVTDINPGMYIIKLETNKGAHHQKLIVK